MYRVVLAEPARRFYENAEASLQRKLDRCFDVLAQTPRRHPNIKPLTGKLKAEIDELRDEMSREKATIESSQARPTSKQPSKNAEAAL